MRLNEVFDCKLGKSKDFLKISLLGAGVNKEKCYTKGIYGKFSQRDIELEYNNILEASGANREKYIGSLSELFQDFLKSYPNLRCKSLEEICAMWEDYYNAVNPGKFEVAVEKFFLFYKNHKLKMMPPSYEWTEENDTYFKNGCRDYLHHLMFYNSPFAFYVESIFFATLSSMLNMTFRKTDMSEERKGIDGWLDEIPFSIKPKSFSKNKKSPVSGILVKYEKNKDDIAFVIEDKALSTELRAALTSA